jgi:hypothetical protein
MTRKQTKKPRSKPCVTDTGGQSAGKSAGDAETLSPPSKMRAAAMLAAGSSIAEVCRGLRLSDRTLRRWRKEPTFQLEVRSFLQDNLALCRSILAAGSGRAARALVNMAADRRTVADAARVSAARAVIDGASKLVEVDELQQKLLELEARLEAALEGGV